METKNKIPSYQKELQTLRSNLSEMLPKSALEVFDEDAKELEKTHRQILKLKPGDKAPDFTLLNAIGEPVRLSELLKKNKVILTFYRGAWCPYCNLQLNQYQRAQSEFIAAGAQLVAISPQTPDASLSMQEKNELGFPVLSDPGNLVTRQFTTVFKYGEAPVETMTGLGYDFNSFYADDSREIPVPAVFIIEQDATISFSKSTGGDYRNRVEAEEIISNLS